MSAPDRRAMVQRPGEDLSVRRQCALLSVARSGSTAPGTRRRGGRSLACRAASTKTALRSHPAASRSLGSDVIHQSSLI